MVRKFYVVVFATSLLFEVADRVEIGARFVRDSLRFVENLVRALRIFEMCRCCDEIGVRFGLCEKSYQIGARFVVNLREFRGCTGNLGFW